MEKETTVARNSYWPDLLAFSAGLIVAGWNGWDTTGLVWSLWLSSFVIGYALIVTHILRGVRLAGEAGGEGLAMNGVPIAPGASKVILTLGALFFLAFFTVHFGGFHWGHSIFLNLFFPVNGEPMRGGFPGVETYWTVVKQNWWFIPLALVAQRAAFRPKAEPAGGADAGTAKALADRFGEGMMAPYKNVVRLHLLIFFFAFTFTLGLKGAPIFVVVYAVYFFPWEILRRKKPAR